MGPLQGRRSEQIRDGWNEATSVDGIKSAVELETRPNGERVVNMGAVWVTLDRMLTAGYTFTPLIAMTETRKAALQLLANVVRALPDISPATILGRAAALETVQEMLNEQEAGQPPTE